MERVKGKEWRRGRRRVGRGGGAGASFPTLQGGGGGLGKRAGQGFAVPALFIFLKN